MSAAARRMARHPAALAALFGICLLWSGAARAADCAADYEGGRYAEAAACWSAMDEAGHHNGHLLYNLGNAWYRAGDVGQAVLAYRRALLFLPRDGDVRANLDAARALARDDLAPPQRAGVAAVLLAPYDELSRSELLLLGTAGWALFWLGVAARFRRLPAPDGVLALGAALAVAGLVGAAVRSYAMDHRPLGVVLAEEVTLRSGRDLRSVDLARLHAGAEVRIVERDGDWTQVELTSGQRGWLPADGLGAVHELPGFGAPVRLD